MLKDKTKKEIRNDRTKKGIRERRGMRQTFVVYEKSTKFFATVCLVSCKTGLFLCSLFFLSRIPKLRDRAHLIVSERTQVDPSIELKDETGNRTLSESLSIIYEKEDI